jgi:hypothetical protein
MNEELKQNEIFDRLKEMGIPVDQPLFTLAWQDVARVMRAYQMMKGRKIPNVRMGRTTRVRAQDL